MKLKYIILPIIATSFAISSCNDFLDREPLTDNVNEGFFTEPSQLQAYCNKKYELLPDFKDTNLFTNDQTSDNQAGTDPVDFFLPQRIKVAPQEVIIGKDICATVTDCYITLWKISKKENWKIPAKPSNISVRFTSSELTSISNI